MTERGEHTPGIVERLRAILPLLDGLETGQDCEEYAFAKANGFQAMTYCPAAFEALRCMPEAADLISELVGALELFQSFGCPRCNGDCGSANPPVSACPMQIAASARAKAHGGAE